MRSTSDSCRQRREVKLPLRSRFARVLPATLTLAVAAITGGCGGWHPPAGSSPSATLSAGGKAAGSGFSSPPLDVLKTAVDQYAAYVETNATGLVKHTGAFCAAIDAGNLHRAQQLYMPARAYYERIEPVATLWGPLAVEIDGRWQNPVMIPAQFIGFHRIERLLWADHTLANAPALCRGLVQHERDLAALVRKAQYSPSQMAAGATQLMVEAANSKLSGEEEKYSNVALPALQANVDGAIEVLTVLRPYLADSGHTDTVDLILQRHAEVTRVMASLRATPGYLATGYPRYDQVSTPRRRSLIAAVIALAESLSQLAAMVG